MEQAAIIGIILLVLLIGIAVWYYWKHKDDKDDDLSNDTPAPAPAPTGTPTTMVKASDWPFFTSPLVKAAAEASGDTKKYTYTFIKSFNLAATSDLNITAAGISGNSKVFFDKVLAIDANTPKAGDYPIASVTKALAGPHEVKVTIDDTDIGNGFSLVVYTTDPKVPIADTSGVWTVTKLVRS